MKSNKLTTLALLTTVALIIFIVEAQIPLPIRIPGVKLGLANIVTVFAVWVMGPWEAVIILLARIFLGAVFAGNFSSVLYSLGGGILAIGTTIGLSFVLRENQIWIAGCLGAIAHSLGQMIVAVLVGGTYTYLIFLPVLIVCSILTGSFTGLCAQILIKRSKTWKITFK